LPTSKYQAVETQDSKLAHRDLKPMNILINEDTNELQVCDFGSAKKICPGEVNVCYICSRYYRAPELMFGFNDYSTEIDMWSFGCILVEMLTTDTLFCGESTLDQIIEVIKVIGTPSQDYLEKSVEFRNLKIPHMKPHSWKAVLKRYDPEPQLLDLIAKVLVFDKS
jgi:serine/threonine protein kinase